MATPRTRYIGASEVSALFDAHPYMTRFQLWHIKAGNIKRPPFAGTERSFWGDVLEPSVARGYCKLHGFDLIELDDDQRFRVHPTIPQCCANLDYMIRRDDGQAEELLECKTSDFIEFRDGFPNGNLPLQYELQLQQQMMCTGKARGVVAVLVGGNELYEYEREYSPAVADSIEKAIRAFWLTVQQNTPPAPTYSKDGKILAWLMRERDGRTGDWRGNNYLNNLCADYLRYAEAESAAKRAKDEVKAELIANIGHASAGFTDGFEITAKMTGEAELAYTRKAYLNLTIKKRKKA